MMVPSPLLQTRIEQVQLFLTEAGFECTPIPNNFSFLAQPKKPIWLKLFPVGLYVRVFFGSPLDQEAVQAICHDAKQHGDLALVVIDTQAKLSAWGEISILRGEQGKRHFVCLPIDEWHIQRSIASHREFQMLHSYVNQRLGQGFDPYDVRDPVSGAVSFFGHQGLAEGLLDSLSRGQRIGLFGIHKIGKTSVLQELQKRAEFPVAYVYLTGGDSPFGIYKRILEAWSIDIRIKYPSLQWSMPLFAENSDFKSVFDSAAKDLLRQLNRVIGTPRLGVFLDEIEHIVPYKESDKKSLDLYVNLMDSLRGLQHETNSFSLLVAGIHPTIARRSYFQHDQENPMYQVIAERFLPPLDKEDCAYMIRSLGQQVNVTFDDEAVEYIIQMSGAHPFLARQICSYAYKNRRDMDNISFQRIQEMCQNFIRNPALASYFDEYGLWGELGKQEIWGEELATANQGLLLALAQVTEESSQDELCSHLEQQVALKALHALKERGIISSSNTPNCYRITFGLFRDWIRAHQVDRG